MCPSVHGEDTEAQVAPGVVGWCVDGSKLPPEMILPCHPGINVCECGKHHKALRGAETLNAQAKILCLHQLLQDVLRCSDGVKCIVM